MKLLSSIFFAGVVCMATQAANKTFFDLSATGIDGKPVDLAKFRGKAVLVVNVASKCGYTPQYKGLEALYLEYKDKGLVVVGFPSNDFGAQEPAENAEIKKFCDLNYKVTFPLMSKAPVTGTAKQPVYKFLTETKNFSGEVKWNFEKFLIGKNGEVVGRFPSKVGPEDAALKSAVKDAVETKTGA